MTEEFFKYGCVKAGSFFSLGIEPKAGSDLLDFAHDREELKLEKQTH
jgi:hypothetical protein